MEMNEKKNSISAMMEASMGKIREMVDSNTVVGEPITTADGVTLIPVSRLSFGFGCGGGDYGKQQDKLGAGAAAGVRVEPMAFLVVKDGVTRMLPVGTPAITTRGLVEADMAGLAAWMKQAIDARDDEARLATLRSQVRSFALKHPLPSDTHE